MGEGEEIDILTQNVINNRSVTRTGINLVITEQESILNTISNQVNNTISNQVNTTISNQVNNTISNQINTLSLDANNTIWLSSNNYSIDRLPPEPDPLSIKLNIINFSIPPLFWNENFSKRMNLKYYRSRRLKYYDPQLYNIKFTKDGKPTRDKKRQLCYSFVCQPARTQPFAFNTNEKREIDNRVLTFAFNNPENPDLPRIINWMKYRNVWYLSCEFICIGCMLPFQCYDLEDNGSCPRCRENKYVIHNNLGKHKYIRLVPSVLPGAVPISNRNRKFSSIYEVWPAIKVKPEVSLLTWKKAYFTMKSALESNLAAFSALQQAYVAKKNKSDVGVEESKSDVGVEESKSDVGVEESKSDSDLAAFPTLQHEYNILYTQNNVNDVNLTDITSLKQVWLKQAYFSMKSAIDSNLAAFSALQQEYSERYPTEIEYQSQKNKEHAALIADVNWRNLYAATSVEGLTRHSGSLLTCRRYSELTESHERDIVHELHDYEANGGDINTICQNINDAASARVWNMFLTNYKSFLRNRDE